MSIPWRAAPVWSSCVRCSSRACARLTNQLNLVPLEVFEWFECKTRGYSFEPCGMLVLQYFQRARGFKRSQDLNLVTDRLVHSSRHTMRLIYYEKNDMSPPKFGLKQYTKHCEKAAASASEALSKSRTTPRAEIRSGLHPFGVL